MIAVVFGLAVFFYFLTSEAGKRWRSGWTAWDWIGAIVLTTGAIVFFSAIVGNFSQSWLIATGHYRGRMIEYGVWAGGAFIIGLGVLPVVAALAGLVRPKDEEADAGAARVHRAPAAPRCCASASTPPSRPRISRPPSEP